VDPKTNAAASEAPDHDGDTTLLHEMLTQLIAPLTVRLHTLATDHHV
jgi:hypothetical protein